MVFRLLEIVEYSQLVGIHNYHQPRRSFHCSSNLFCFSCRNPLKHRITDEALEAQSWRLRALDLFLYLPVCATYILIRPPINSSPPT